MNVRVAGKCSFFGVYGIHVCVCVRERDFVVYMVYIFERERKLGRETEREREWARETEGESG